MYKRDKVALTLTLLAAVAFLGFYAALSFLGLLPAPFTSRHRGIDGGEGGFSTVGLADPDRELGIAVGDFRYRFSEEGVATVTMPRELNMPAETLEIPEAVTWRGQRYRVEAIRPYALLHQPALKRLRLPSGIDQFILFCDPGNTALEAVDVSPENPRLVSVDGVVFNRRMTTLLFYPPGRDRPAYTLPQGVVAVAQYAFQNARYTRTATFADGRPVVAAGLEPPAGQPNASLADGTGPSPR